LPPVRGALRRLVLEPLFHFLLIGLAVFAVHRAIGPSSPRPDQAVIEVTPAVVERIVGQFEAVWRRPPTAAEQAGLIDDYLREEVYYREALALGLDRDDTVIRRRLRQKMEFLGDAGAGALEATDAELQSYLQAHPERFARPARVTFRQVFVANADPGPALAALAGGADPASVGVGSLLPPTMEAAVASSVDGPFGGGFFAEVAALAPGAWQGPVASAYGNHLVWVEEREPAATPAFEEVRRAVEEAWRRDKAAELGEAAYQALRRRYEVVLP
jgi:hypothetical protein